MAFSRNSASSIWGIGDVHSQDGYKLIKAEQLVAALGALNERKITFRAFRTYMGSFELLAIREAAERSNRTGLKKPQRRFLRSEIARLIGAKEGTTVSRELFSLKKVGLLRFSETDIVPLSGSGSSEDLVPMLGSRGITRLVPVPRQMLKYLARCTRPAVAKTVVAYLLRGLALERTGGVRSAGTVKVSWICKLCRISERAARAARAELIRLGWISKDTGSFQRKLNRDGAYFRIDAFWRRSAKQSAPLDPRKCMQSAPPREKLETPYGSKNQKTAERNESGVCLANEEMMAKAPNIRAIQIVDLQRLSRLRSLYRQALAEKWLSESEANFVNFVAAAARATRVNGDAVRVFVGIVRKALWHHLTGEDERRAFAALQRDRERQCRAEKIAENMPRAESKAAEGTIRFVLDIAMRSESTKGL